MRLFKKSGEIFSCRIRDADDMNLCLDSSESSGSKGIPCFQLIESEQIALSNLIKAYPTLASFLRT